ncbi:prolyl oligopeptidase family serine peptidase [uncultured Microbacterium sp.]|uniref:prolyl oligopeptidase family serine peptidase n=1 Tax=uncultured Microbacterium sp. TaxID=191216 RepID=UPI0026136E4C|nr:prolyl oligopeptidase family serine peptidase [uncultured Microbacterium sp.]
MNPEATPAPDTDENLWLEEIHAPEALAWAASESARTDEHFASPARTALTERLLTVLDDPERLALPSRRGAWIYNFWRDADHPRGLWRRATRASYLAGDPAWQVLLDVDGLGRAEGTAYSFGGAAHGPRGSGRALVRLSPDGGDAVIVREFDLDEAHFVTDASAFALPTAKQHTAWLDADTLLIASPLDGGALTASGYPRTARLWRRGEPLASAQTLIEADESDVGVVGGGDRTGREADIDTSGDPEVTAIVRVGHDFWRRSTWVAPWRAGAHTVELERLAVPDDAESSVHGGFVLVRPSTPWRLGPEASVAPVIHPAGTLLAGSLAALTGDAPEPHALTPIFTPSEHTVLETWAWTRTRLVLTLLDDVRTRLVALDPQADWAASDLDAGAACAADMLTAEIVSTDADEDDEVWVRVSGFLTPPTLIITDAASPAARVIDAQPAVFEASGLETTQHWAISADGTRVPYFQVGRPGATGAVLMNGYGGFEHALTPEYASIVGPAWLESGGIYVVTGIRGGGEFGPAWHRAALRENRHRAYEDFVAVARDLVARGVTTPEQIGCHGRSNGGLLVGNMLTQFPDDFGAIVCGVPLLDMQRYTHLSAGASWIAEYGDPDDPADWAFIQTFSPYHLIEPGRAYPPSLIYTATSDDRVGPVQARKMAARLRDRTDASVFYLEQTEGGHAGTIDNRAVAELHATIYAFLTEALGR